MSNLTTPEDATTRHTPASTTAIPKPAFNAALNNDAPDPSSSSLAEAGPGLVVFLGALTIVSVGVVALLCGSVCITASKRAKRRAHFRNRIRSECPPCPQCGALCKEPTGVLHVAMCDVHGPIPTTVSASSRTNLAFVKDGTRRASLTGGSGGLQDRDDSVVVVSKPAFLRTPVILLDSDLSCADRKATDGE